MKRSILIGIMWLFWSADMFAGSVRQCNYTKKTKRPVRFCEINMPEAKTGDRVEIRNDYNSYVALGRVVKGGRSRRIVIIEDETQKILPGYTVIVVN